jgi:hypothetical protein
MAPALPTNGGWPLPSLPDLGSQRSVATTSRGVLPPVTELQQLCRAGPNHAMTKLPASGRDADTVASVLACRVATLHGAPQTVKPTGFNIAYMLPTKSSIGVADVSLDTGLLSHGPLRKHGQRDEATAGSI